MPEILTRKGEVIIVDEEDFVELSKHTWCIRRGYARRNIPCADTKTGQREVAMHRVILGLTHGDRLEADHINGDTLDNRRANLRVCAHAENVRNIRYNSKNTSGYKGVSYHKVRRKFQAYIGVNGKRLYLGLHDTAEEAHAAYRKAADQYHGEFANYGSLTA